ncbi:MAG: hypothetical protein V3U94_05100, partial [Candidatus Thorarchaeota archaeon]
LAESGFIRLCASHRNTMGTSASMTELQRTQAKERSSDCGYRDQILQPDSVGKQIIGVALDSIQLIILVRLSLGSLKSSSVIAS